MKDRVVVITGASEGIGAVLAENISKKGAKVVLVARREEKLNDVAKKCAAETLVVPADVTVRDDLKRVVAKAIERFGHVDVLVNNAGRGISRSVLDLSDEDVDDMVRINVKSVLYGIQAVMPHFVERGEGHIVNVSTMLARVPFAPIRSMYAACKAAVNSLSSSLRVELLQKHPGIHVSVVHPGVVATDFGLNAMHGGPDNRKLPGAQPASEVAEVLAGVIEKPRADVYTRAGAQQVVAAYYSAEDMGAAEKSPPFTR